MTGDAATALPLVLVLALACLLILRSGEVRWWVGLLFFLFGFYAGATPVGEEISGAVRWLVERIAG